jgi:short-subunit dehydrogenase
MDLNNKTVVLTHVNNMLGRALAKALDKEGAVLILSDGDETGLTELAKELKSDRHMLVPGDINIDKGRVQLISACRDKDTSIDILINNPLQGAQGSFRATPQSDISQFINSSLTAPILLTRALFPQLAKRDSALIVNIGTLSASIGLPGFAIDCAGRFGLRGFSEALARELQNTSVKTTYVAHRGIKQSNNKTTSTNLSTALKRPLDKPEAVAKTVIKAIVDEAPFNQMGRLERYWIKLNTCVPKWMDKAVFKRLPIYAHFAKQRTFRER